MNILSCLEKVAVSFSWNIGKIHLPIVVCLRFKNTMTLFLEIDFVRLLADRCPTFMSFERFLLQDNVYDMFRVYDRVSERLSTTAVELDLVLLFIFRDALDNNSYLSEVFWDSLLQHIVGLLSETEVR